MIKIMDKTYKLEWSRQVRLRNSIDFPTRLCCDIQVTGTTATQATYRMNRQTVRLIRNALT